MSTDLRMSKGVLGNSGALRASSGILPNGPSGSGSVLSSGIPVGSGGILGRSSGSSSVLGSGIRYEPRKSAVDNFSLSIVNNVEAENAKVKAEADRKQKIIEDKVKAKAASQKAKEEKIAEKKQAQDAKEEQKAANLLEGLVTKEQSKRPAKKPKTGEAAEAAAMHKMPVSVKPADMTSDSSAPGLADIFHAATAAADQVPLKPTMDTSAGFVPSSSSSSVALPPSLVSSASFTTNPTMPSSLTSMPPELAGPKSSFNQRIPSFSSSAPAQPVHPLAMPSASAVPPSAASGLATFNTMTATRPMALTSQAPVSKPSTVPSNQDALDVLSWMMSSSGGISSSAPAPTSQPCNTPPAANAAASQLLASVSRPPAPVSQPMAPSGLASLAGAMGPTVSYSGPSSMPGAAPYGRASLAAPSLSSFAPQAMHPGSLGNSGPSQAPNQSTNLGMPSLPTLPTMPAYFTSSQAPMYAPLGSSAPASSNPFAPGPPSMIGSIPPRMDTAAALAKAVSNSGTSYPAPNNGSNQQSSEK